ncbi:MAG: ribosome silencing factor [Candidatus Omnitrophica bacterium]|nr:ribosome silencing factor [Candidatus Omnitrophota bacterium]
MTSRQIAIAMAQAAVEVKAEGLAILDLRKLSFSFDFFVLSNGSSTTQIRSMADRIRERLSLRGREPHHGEGVPEGGWVLLDYGSVVGHLFLPEQRLFYGLDRLWADAPRVRIPKTKSG